MVFITEKGRVVCLNTVEGKKGNLCKKIIELDQLWSLDLSSEAKARMVLAGSQILIITDSGSLVKINSESGEVLSQDKLTGFKEGYGMAVYENDLIISVSKDCSRLKNII